MLAALRELGSLRSAAQTRARAQNRASVRKDTSILMTSLGSHIIGFVLWFFSVSPPETRILLYVQRSP